MSYRCMKKGTISVIRCRPKFENPILQQSLRARQPKMHRPKSMKLGDHVDGHTLLCCSKIQVCPIRYTRVTGPAVRDIISLFFSSM